MRQQGARGGGDGGFTFVEVFVVLIILAVLAGIAIATYVDQVRKADRAAALAVLGDVPVVAESLAADTEDAGYVDEPSGYEQQLGIDVVPGTTSSAAPDELSVVAAVDGSWVSFAVDGRDHCYYLRLERSANRRFEHREPRGTVSCTAVEFDATNPAADGWGG